MLILRTLRWGPAHGHGIATAIERTSEDMLLVDHGSLYPALQRLEQAGLISSEWGVSENKRRARLAAETSKWEKMVRAVSRILEAHRRQSVVRAED